MNRTGALDPAASPVAGKAGRRDGAALLLIFLLAAAVRLASWRRVFTADGVVFIDGDSYYKMWRIWNAASGDLWLPQREPFANFPHGGEIIWAPAFDWTVAAVVKLLGLDRTGAEVLCAWVPLVLGSIAVVIASDLARRSFSRSAGWFTGILLALLVGSFNYSQLGFLDHHAAITLIGVLMLAGAMRVVAAPPLGPRGWPLFAGALAAVALLTWSGSLLHCVVLQLALGVWALLARDRSVARERTRRLALAQAIAAAAIWPVAGGLSWKIYGEFTPLVLSRFQPVWLGAGAVCLAASAALWRSDLLGGTRVRRVATAVTVGAVGLLAAFAVVPGLQESLDRSSGWFTGDVSFNVAVNELAPLWGRGDRPDWSRPFVFLTPLILAYPFVAVALVWRSRRPDHWLLVYWSAVFFALTLAQIRFINTYSVSYAIVLGAGAASIAATVARWCAGRRVWIAVCSCAALLAAAAVLSQTLQFYRAYLEPRREEGELTLTSAKMIRKQAFLAAASHLAATAPAVADAAGQPTYAVLCAWGFGHEVRYRANLPVVQDPFGPFVSPEGVDAAARYFGATDESEALAVLEELAVRYVIADYKGAGQQDVYRPRALTPRLIRLHGSGGRVGRVGQFGQRRFTRALGRHRLVFYAANDLGGIHVYEILPAAALTGSTLPGAPVTATLPLRTASGMVFDWVDRVRADQSGRFELRLPYATRGGDFSQVEPTGPYRLASEGAEIHVEVPEAAVRGGLLVEASPFDFGAPADPPSGALTPSGPS